MLFVTSIGLEPRSERSHDHLVDLKSAETSGFAANDSFITAVS